MLDRFDVFESFTRNKAWLDWCLTEFDRCLTELGRVDLCLEMSIEMGREMGIEREQQIRKKWVKRERARAYVKRLVERNLKKN